MLQRLIHWFEHHLLSCPIKQRTGLSCPGCGMQRAFVELLKGNFHDSFYLYPALIPIILLFVFVILHIIFDFKHGASIIVFWFSFNMSIVFINYVIYIVNVR